MTLVRAYLLIACLLPPLTAHADQKSDDVARMMSLSGETAAAYAAQADPPIDAIIQRFSAAQPNIPPDAIVTLRATVLQQELAMFQAVEAVTRSRYYASMSDDEVRAVLAFETSPAGQVYLRESIAIRHDFTAQVAHIFPALVAEIKADFIAALKRRTPPPQAG